MSRRFQWPLLMLLAVVFLAAGASCRYQKEKVTRIALPQRDLPVAVVLVDKDQPAAPFPPDSQWTWAGAEPVDPPASAGLAQQDAAITRPETPVRRQPRPSRPLRAEPVALPGAAIGTSN